MAPLKKNPWDRVARECLEDVLSPVLDSVDSPLFREVERIRDKRSKVAADLGCGSGALLPTLLESFGRVVAVDASREMLALARERIRELYPAPPSTLDWHRRSLRRLEPFASSFDVCFCLNSVIMAEPASIRRALESIAASLVPSGLFIGVFPALESAAEAFRYCYRSERRKTGSHRTALTRARRRFAPNRIDFALGWLDVGYMLQKLYTRQELEGYLSEAGFRQLRFQRLEYSSSIAWVGVDRYPGTPPAVWHWFVRGLG